MLAVVGSSIRLGGMLVANGRYFCHRMPANSQQAKIYTFQFIEQVPFSLTSFIPTKSTVE